MDYAVYLEKPKDFVAQVEVAGCYFWCNERLLLLRRHDDKPQGGTWGVPAGKLEPQESAQDAVIREIREEVGVDISQNLTSIGQLYITLPHISYIYHMFYRPYEHYPELTLAQDENVEVRWVSLEEAKTLPLIKGALEALERFKIYINNIVV